MNNPPKRVHKSILQKIDGKIWLALNRNENVKKTLKGIGFDTNKFSIRQLWNEALYFAIVIAYLYFIYIVTEAITLADTLQIGGIALIIFLHKVLLKNEI